MIIRDLAIFTPFVGSAGGGIAVQPQPSSVPPALEDHCFILQCVFENLFLSTQRRGLDFGGTYIQNCTFRNIVAKKMGMGLLFIDYGSVITGERLNIESSFGAGTRGTDYETNEDSAAITLRGGSVTLRDCLVEGVPETVPFYRFGGLNSFDSYTSVFSNNYSEHKPPGPEEEPPVTHRFEHIFNGQIDLALYGKCEFDFVHAYLSVLDQQGIVEDVAERLLFLDTESKLAVGQAIVSNWPLAYPATKMVFLNVYEKDFSIIFQPSIPGDKIVGPIPDNRLTSNVALLNAANTFTNAPQTITKAVSGAAGINVLSITPTWSGAITGTANDIHVNATDSGMTSGTHNLMNLRVGGVTKCVVTNAGALSTAVSVSTATVNASTLASGTNTNLSIMAGNGLSAAGANLSLSAGAGDSDYDGGNVSISGGAGGLGAGSGGTVVIAGGVGGDASGVAGAAGGNIALAAGDGGDGDGSYAAGDGGTLILAAGSAGADGGGGPGTSGAVAIQVESTNRIVCNPTGIGFFAATPVAKPTIYGIRASNTALADLLTKLASLGLVIDSTTAT